MITRAALTAVLIIVTTVATPVTVEAQGSQTSVWRLAILGGGSASPEITAPLVDGLRALGYVEGQNITIEYRWADGKFERLPDLAADLVRLKVDLIVAFATQAAVAAKNATSTIPVVIAGVSDPVGAGVVSSLGRPGGNVTGTSNMAAAVAAKQLALLKEALPKISNVAVLWNPANPVFQEVQLRETTLAGRKLNLQLRIIGARTVDELDRAFSAMTKDRVEALHLLVDPLFGFNAHRIAGLIAKYRVPTVGGSRHYIDAGAFMTYGPNYADGYRHAATYVDRILRGARPADLPVEQSTKFELVINSTAAKALGLTIPSSLLLRADQIIE